MSKRYTKFMLETARVWSKASYCKRNQVGAVIAKDNRIISIGYNGTIAGKVNTCEEVIVSCSKCNTKYNASELLDSMVYESICVRCKGCKTNLVYTKDYLLNLKPVTSDFVLHAEQNALMFCTKNGIATNGCTIYITLSPCKQCAKLIAQAGITKVVYIDKYKDTSGIEFLEKLNIKVIQRSIDD